MPRVTLVVGQAQQGKTTLAFQLLQHDAVRGLILDPARSKPFTGHALTVTSWQELAAFLMSDQSDGRWTVVLRSMDFHDYVAALEAAPFYRHVTLLVDEGLTIASDKEAVEPFIRLCRMNAHFGNGLGVPAIITAQRPHDLPPDIRSQADRWFSFRQEEPRDLQYLSERCSPDFAARVAGLGPHQVISFPSPQGVAEERQDVEGLEGSGLRAGRDGRAGRLADDSTAERHSQASHSHQVMREEA